MAYTFDMDENEVQAYIVRRLTQSAKTSEIALELADKEHIYYDDALKLVETVQGERAHEVEMRHAPLVFAMSAVMLALGGAVTLVAIYALLGILFGLSSISAIGPLNASNVVITLINLGGPIFALLVFGMALIAGGAVGLRRLGATWARKSS